MDNHTNTAIYVKNATKCYGKNIILNGLNMHVQKGIIYGLLGSSGCGKTTLLNCMVGRKRFDSGFLWVLGGPPGSAESGIPGPRIGFMPQAVSLISEFTVKAAIYYFGRIACMKDSEIKRRFEELTHLFELPPGDRCIADCSGGQQRRISFAVALVNSPELIILDEPTVGLDPILRESIWNYLLKLTHLHSTSIILTTHYIEEAKQAQQIGLMRNGKLLTEDSPQNILRQFNTHSLESVFLTLCKTSEERTLFEPESHDSVTELNMDILSASSRNAFSEVEHSQELQLMSASATENSAKKFYTANTYSLNPYRLNALLGKSWFQITRSHSGVYMMFLLPIFQIFSFFLGIGDDVKSINIAVLNQEDNFGFCGNYTHYTLTTPTGDDCKFQQLGCYYIQQLDDPMTKVVFYDNIDKAKDAVRFGDAKGALNIPKNFTESFQRRFINAVNINTPLENSQIEIWMDMSGCTWYKSLGENVSSTFF